MSVHNSQRLNQKQSGRPPVCFTPANLVDTNLLLKEAIQKLSPEIRGEVVLRCDELVQLQCSYDCCEKTFTFLLQLVAKAKPVDKKLFLHITCFPQSKDNETIGLGLKRYIIQFHTNISLHAEGLPEMEKQISKIASLLVPHGGSLQVNQLKNSGCVFSISLPGK